MAMTPIYETPALAGVSLLAYWRHSPDWCPSFSLSGKLAPACPVPQTGSGRRSEGGDDGSHEDSQCKYSFPPNCMTTRA